jgi:predicted ATPase
LLALLEVPVEGSAWEALDPAQRRQRTLDALKSLLLRQSQAQPLLLVVENLHWIAAETQEFLDGLVESLPTARMLLLVNYRPQYQHGWGKKTYYAQLRLDPLPTGSAEAWLQSLLGDNAGLAPLKARLIAQTQGNPFFLEESVRTLVETQGLVGTPGAYRLAQALPSIQVPATVQAVLAARIDRLPPEEKQFLQTAAVIGTEVALALLKAVAEVPEEVLRLGLSHLQAAEFLYETRLFPEHEYTFKHALTQQVAYGSLLQERRRCLHGRIVKALEALARDCLDDQVERLAYHALQGAVWDGALAYLRHAGDKAMARSAHQVAVGYFEQALGTLAHLPEQRDTHAQAIDLHLALRTALIPLGDPARLFTHRRAAEALAAQLGDGDRQGRIATYWTRDLGVTGHHEQAVAYGQRALTLLHGDVVLRMTTQLCLSYAYY